ncbi:MAG: hypothetical protein U0T31_04760 [Chitinophagales bacterium]|nr:hypothetical protein [Chitinophagales bacterium]
MKKYAFYFLCSFISYFASTAQDIDGVWTGNFIQYIHNTYDVQLNVKKLPPGNIFSARLRITDSYYFGEYNISGFICNKKYLEISTIVLLRESGASNWIDCLNGTFDLNDDETELTFTDTWLLQDQRNNTCKLKYIQKDMFQCLRSAYLHKAKYQSEIAEFEKIWDKATITKKLNKAALDEMLANTKPSTKKTDTQPLTQIIPIVKQTDTARLIAQHEKELKETPKQDIAEKIEDFNKSETKLVAKNEDRAPVIEDLEEMKSRKVQVKDEIEVSNSKIVIEYWDRYTEDGDSVNIYLNKKPILQNVLLTKAKKSITVVLDKTKNYLVLEAINLGKEPPNTASVTVKDGKKIQNVSLTSTMKTSGALKIVVNKK